MGNPFLFRRYESGGFNIIDRGATVMKIETNRTETSMTRRIGTTAMLFAGALALGACSSISDAFDGVNPISRTLDSTSKKKSASTEYRQPLAIPPDFSLRPPAGRVERRATRDSKASETDGKATATVTAADPKKIDLGVSSSSEKINRKTIDSSGAATATGKVVREGRVETRGKAIVKDGSRSKGEDELLKRSTKNGS